MPLLFLVATWPAGVDALVGELKLLSLFLGSGLYLPSLLFEVTHGAVPHGVLAPESPPSSTKEQD